MKLSKMRINLAFFALALGSLIGLHACGAGSDTDSVTQKARGSTCEGDLGKIEGSSGSYEAASIGSICIKAGQNVLTFECGEVDASGCYDVAWTETEGCCTAVVIGGGGTSSECKTISHTAASSADSCPEPPTPTPTPTPTPVPH
jgi:hypothetical protein